MKNQHLRKHWRKIWPDEGYLSEPPDVDTPTDVPPQSDEVPATNEPGDAEPEPQPVTDGPRRSSRMRKEPSRLIPSLFGKAYKETGVTQVEEKYDMEYTFACVTHTVMTQLSMKAGMKKWGPAGEGAVSKELSQLHYRDSFEPLNPKKLTKEERDAALESHLFLKQKRDLSIKGRMVAGGDKQRGTIEKEKASSPTVATESVLLTATIDAEEGRDVATVDLPNAFIQTRLENPEDKVVMRLRGTLAELMVKLAPGNLQQVCHYQQQRRKGSLCSLAECSLRHNSRCVVIL